ncbi:MAG: porin family protein [Ginsengibacter sp.]
MLQIQINKNLFLSLFASLLFSFLLAQDHSSPRVNFVIVVGANASNMNFNKGVPAPATPIARTWKTGLSLGFLINVPLAEKLYLQPGYYYVQRNGADKSTRLNYLVDYLSLPVLLKYEISPVISILAGPEGSLLISAKQNSNGVKTTITHDFEERSVGATGGIDFLIKNNFLISARLMEGLNHIGIGQRSDVKEFKYESASLSFGINF